MHTRFSRKGVHGFFRDMTKGTTGVPLFVVFRIDLLRSLEQFFAFIGQLSVYHLVEQTVQRCADGSPLLVAERHEVGAVHRQIAQRDACAAADKLLKLPLRQRGRRTANSLRVLASPSFWRTRLTCLWVPSKRISCAMISCRQSAVNALGKVRRFKMTDAMSALICWCPLK